MAGDARDRDRRRDTEEDEQRRHQKSAADAEHAGNEPDRETHGQNDKNVDRQVGDRKVDLHGLIRWFEMRLAPNLEPMPMYCYEETVDPISTAAWTMRDYPLTMAWCGHHIEANAFRNCKFRARTRIMTTQGAIFFDQDVDISWGRTRRTCLRLGAVTIFAGWWDHNHIIPVAAGRLDIGSRLDWRLG